VKVAVIHDWLGPMTGAERVLQQILRCYPGADVFTAIDYLPARHRALLGGSRVVTSFIQRLPRARTRYWNYIPLMPWAFEGFDLTGYDLVISNSHTVAKGVVPREGQVHVCYLETPMRFAWDLESYYLKRFRMDRGLKGAAARFVVRRLRRWDVATAARVDSFVACSEFVSRRCKTFYHRDAEVVYPPVDVDYFTPDAAQKEDFFLVASRLTPFKRVDLIVEAFRALPNRKLVVIGDGPERDRVASLCSTNVTFLGYQPDDVLRDHMRRARAFVYAAPEDFGIVMAEAQACGTPVIALEHGGATEIVQGPDSPAPTGVFFDSQSVVAVVDAVSRFERDEGLFAPPACRRNALRFEPRLFREALVRYVDAALHRKGRLAAQ